MDNIIGNILVSLVGAIPIQATMLFICLIIFNLKVPFRQLVLYISIASVITAFFKFLEVYYGNIPEYMLMKTLMSTIISVILAILILKMKPLFSILAFSITSIICALGNVVTLFAFSLFHISITQFKSSLVLMLVAHGTIACLACIILLILWLYKSLFHLSMNIKSSELKKFTFNLILILSLCVINAYFWNSVPNLIMPSTLFIVDIIFLLAFLIVSVLNLNIYIKHGKTNAELEVQIFYNNSMQTWVDETRRIKHNFNNTVATIAGYVKLKSWAKLETFIDDIYRECLSINSLEILMSLKIENAALLGLLGAKLDLSKGKNINLNISSQSAIEHLNANMYLLCEILGCLIDNAIEAAYESSEKYVQLNIKEADQDIIFEIENSFKIRPEINEIYKKGTSSKGEGRGIGLYFVKERVNRERNLCLNTYIKNNIFIQELIVENGKSLGI